MHASFLGDIPTFGLHVFYNHLNVLKGKSLECLFTGENAFQFQAEKPILLTLISLPGCRSLSLRQLFILYNT